MKGQHSDFSVGYKVSEEHRSCEAPQDVNGHESVEEKNAIQEHETDRKNVVACADPESYRVWFVGYIIQER